ncbi:MAG: hypothetical protein KDI90_06550 [Alphaproteobacteria bacterium]|nr:hypothetical protein [Alphaproteobacteria bacterium]MCB9974974.1 hypothetical protein [Rhodospirillales bacterium]
MGSPKVKKDANEVMLRFGYSEADEESSDDERFRTRLHLDHGFTDYYAARLIVSGDKRKNDSLEHDALTLENRFYLLKADEYGFDFGARASYSLKDGDKKPDKISVGFYELVPLDAYEIRANQIFDHEIGEDSEDGIGAELRFQVTRKVSDDHKLGLESFHDFGNLKEQSGYSAQAHTFGPVLKGKIFENYKYETGYRVGISKDAPDHSIKFFISREF